MSEWSSFYRGRNTEGYLEHVKKRYDPFISAVAGAVGDSFSELGCGTGTITRSLLDKGRGGRHVLLDRDAEMLRFAGDRTDRHRAKVTLRRGNMTQYHADTDVVHSHGVLEHMSDGMIRRTIWNNLHTTQIHYVPGLYDKPSFGDERLMSVAEWNTICKPDKVVTFNNGLDYILFFGRKQ